ncbi:MAG: hypothetical protein A3H96_16785 [Acidobacteria bacterium RIFCSPLOWO2_02_FULL_67_36]|nr:MAG: hypothetical protein A3H96_16785 [Acidobacteria bacterium RIFCSPLOWO2_02_FULL_67_36]OFW21518.1 MAG: hypothetical protein A3G21_00180 [Acidobacteria bacterium RIFCSPLOWO2_12_FULL_66_21]
MKGNRAALVVVVAIVLVAAGWWLFKRSTRAASIDLIASFETAKKQPDASMFSVGDATLNGETRKAIAVQPTVGTRLTYKVMVPDDAWLRVYVGLKPEAWEKPGDGVLFFFGVSDGRTWDPLFTQVVDPFNNKADRRWIQVMVDLSAYAGEEVDVIFNTRSAQEGKPDNHDNDLALWGTPEIVVR